jgi:hypothetical protein
MPMTQGKISPSALIVSKRDSRLLPRKEVVMAGLSMSLRKNLHLALVQEVHPSVA